MQQLGRLTLGKVAALLTVGTVVVLAFGSGGRMFSPGDLNAESRENIPLGGVSSHAEIGGNCSACHAPPWSSETMSDRCLVCHTEIRRQLESQDAMHGKLSGGANCRTCHTEHKGPHATLTSLADFDHECARFQLTGKHRSLDCQACHENNRFKGTPQSCVSCHTEPSVHKGKFGVACAQCHSTTSWTGAVFTLKTEDFNHDQTGFKLTGRHNTVDCKSCHVGNVFKGTPKSCVSCHAEPVVHKGKFGTACAQCHSTSDWKGAVVAIKPSEFNHDLTGFKLTGKHQMVDCKSCHVGNVFKGTPQTCVGCHAEPAVHKGKFGNACAQCHTTSTWGAAKFTHTFPLKHGRGKGTCATCHKDAPDYKAYTCYGCHEHQPAKMEKRHPKLSATKLQECAKCHPTGRGHENKKKFGKGVSLEWEVDCPGMGSLCVMGNARQMPECCGYDFSFPSSRLRTTHAKLWLRDHDARSWSFEAFVPKQELGNEGKQELGNEVKKQLVGNLKTSLWGNSLPPSLALEILTTKLKSR
jgi:hypothetical protein